MSNLSELLPAGAGGKQVSFTASGAIGNGVTVGLNSDGTVSVVEITSVSEAVGTPVVFESAASRFYAAAYDANAQKVVIAYQDIGNSSYGTAIVGTVSGTSISFGTPRVFESATTLLSTRSAAYDANAQKVVIAYRDYGNSSKGTAIVGTVSGTSISFGGATVFETGSSDHFSVVYDANTQKTVIAYEDGGNSNHGTAIVGTVSGTSISFGSPVVFESANSLWISAVYDSSAQKVVIAYEDNGNSNYGTAIVGTVSGTSISFGTAVVFESANAEEMSAAYDPNAQKVVIAYKDRDNNDYGTAIVGTVSGTSISFGTAAVFETAASADLSAVYAANSQKVVIAYRDGGNSNYGTVIVGTVSGTSISFGTATVFETAASDYISAVYDTNAQNVVIAYEDGGNSNHGTAVVFQNAYTSTNVADFIGISDAAISDTATGSVIVQGGVSENVSGLTANTDYYVQTDGSLSTTVSSVPAGRALSSTSILLEG
jgi:hypothetical protein